MKVFLMTALHIEQVKIFTSAKWRENFRRAQYFDVFRELCERSSSKKYIFEKFKNADFGFSRKK